MRELHRLVFPPGLPVATGCQAPDKTEPGGKWDGGRVFRASLGSLTYRDLDCKPGTGGGGVFGTIGTCHAENFPLPTPLLPGFIRPTSTPYFATQNPALNGVGPCVHADVTVADECQVDANCPTQKPHCDASASPHVCVENQFWEGPITDPSLSRVPNLPGRVLHLFTAKVRELAPFPVQQWDGGVLKAEGCHIPAERAVLFVMRSDSCGTPGTWTGTVIDLNGMSKPDMSDVYLGAQTVKTKINKKSIDDPAHPVEYNVMMARSPSSDVFGPDRSEIYADPFRGRVYITSTWTLPALPSAVGQEQNFREFDTTVLLSSGDGGITWKVDHEFQDLGSARTMSSTPEGLLFTSECAKPRVNEMGKVQEPGFSDADPASYYPVVHAFDIRTTPARLVARSIVAARDSARALIPCRTASYPATEAVGPLAGRDRTLTRNTANTSISRVVGTAENQRLRLVYPTTGPADPADAQVERLAVVGVTVQNGLTCSPDCAAVAPFAVLNLAVVGGATTGPTTPHYLFPDFIESDRMEYTPAPGQSDRAILHWLEWPTEAQQQNGGNVARPRAMGFDGFEASAVFDLDTSTPNGFVAPANNGEACETNANCDSKSCNKLLTSVIECSASAGVTTTCPKDFPGGGVGCCTGEAKKPCGKQGGSSCVAVDADTQIGRCDSFMGDYTYGAFFSRGTEARYFAPWQTTARILPLATGSLDPTFVRTREVSWP